MDKTGLQILCDIIILKDIYWIKGTMSDVKLDTIQKCFYKCGFSSMVFGLEIYLL